MHLLSYLLKKTALQLIKLACLDGYSTYDGRRIAMMYKTSSRKKVPIPINPELHIFAFPTMSPSQFDCNWIFYNHVQAIKPTTKKLSQTIITFKYKEQLALKESYYTIEKQMYRTAVCMLSFSQQNKQSS
ncbi:competence protein ComK [Terrihalobacillus insolitus]|uniref:competence protein ComK n=1 Tax=Terrihalobacillus insolitus TaxID=2950438 RepID=UPI00233FEBA0|nr:competence protein ComK [Terrihalobacillus insolitus]